MMKESLYIIMTIIILIWLIVLTVKTIKSIRNNKSKPVRLISCIGIVVGWLNILLPIYYFMDGNYYDMEMGMIIPILFILLSHITSNFE